MKAILIFSFVVGFTLVGCKNPGEQATSGSSQNPITSPSQLTSTVTTTPSQTLENIKNWKPSVKPSVTHGTVFDQGISDFCWAYAMAAYFNSEMLQSTLNSSQGEKLIELSPLYFAKWHFLDVIAGTSQSVLKLSNNFEQDPNNPSYKSQAGKIGAKLTYDYYPFEDAVMKNGAAPNSLYGQNPTLNTIQQPFADAAISSFASAFIQNKLFANNSLLINSSDEREEISKAFDDSIGGMTLESLTSFEINHQNYTPVTFLESYVKQFSSETTYVPPSDVNIWSDQSIIENNNTVIENDLKVIDYNIKNHHAVALIFQLLNDAERNSDPIDASGVFNVENCTHKGVFGEKACTQDTGHVVLIVNTLKDKDDVIRAFVVQNSWGLRGRNDLGMTTRNSKEKGFYVLPIEYLERGRQLDSGHWAFTYYPTVYPPSDGASGTFSPHSVSSTHKKPTHIISD